MRIFRRLFVLGLTLWLSLWCSSLAAVTVSPDRHAQDPRREILVLLRLPAPHYNPNSYYSQSYGESAERSARWRIAKKIAGEHGLTLVDDWPMALIGVDCFIMAVPDNQSPEAAAAAVSRLPEVDWSEPTSIFHTQGATPASKPALFRVQPAAHEWRLADLHEIATGRNVRVAIIDSNIERSHPDLVGQVEIAENFVDGQVDASESHGTGVAGIIAARGDDRTGGIVGIAPNARLMALRACWQPALQKADEKGTICDSLSLAKALYFAITHKAEVINLSLSGPKDPLLGKLIDLAIGRGIVVVGAFDRAVPDGGFPASHTGVVAVVDEPAGLLPTGVFAAPGRDVPTTQPGGRWYLVSGSSYATAHVSGLFALLRERSSARRNASAIVVSPTGRVIDACATLLRASGPCDCECSRPKGYAARIVP